jgi:hypothetical protein
VIARLDPDAVLRRFGKPDRIETCGGHEIWRYDRPLTGFDAG